MKQKTIYLFIFLILFFIACQSPSVSVEEQTPSKSLYIPDFDADSAYGFVYNQVDFGPRVPNTKAHADCGVYLTSTLQRFADTVLLQEYRVKAYDGTMLHGKNIIGVFNPLKKVRILLAAHWDSRPYADHDPDPENRRKPIDGANDGASGVGVLLEIARQLQLKRPDIGVDIILFDVEDYGAPQDSEASYSGEFWCLGSQYWAKNQHIRNYSARYGILLDMVGGENAVFTHEGTSRYYAPDILSHVWSIAEQLGYGSNFRRIETPPITDDHLYVNQIARIPMIDIIEYSNTTSTGFNQYWHTLNDNISNIDKNTLQKVGKVVLATLYHEE